VFRQSWQQLELCRLSNKNILKILASLNWGQTIIPNRDLLLWSKEQPPDCTGQRLLYNRHHTQLKPIPDLELLRGIYGLNPGRLSLYPLSRREALLTGPSAWLLRASEPQLPASPPAVQDVAPHQALYCERENISAVRIRAVRRTKRTRRNHHVHHIGESTSGNAIGLAGVRQ
jgi:hypothetical protein